MKDLTVLILCKLIFILLKCYQRRKFLKSLIPTISGLYTSNKNRKGGRNLVKCLDKEGEVRMSGKYEFI